MLADDFLETATMLACADRGTGRAPAEAPLPHTRYCRMDLKTGEVTVAALTGATLRAANGGDVPSWANADWGPHDLLALLERWNRRSEGKWLYWPLDEDSARSTCAPAPGPTSPRVPWPDLLRDSAALAATWLRRAKSPPAMAS